MAGTKISDVRSAATLLKKLLEKVDDGDKVLTAPEFQALNYAGPAKTALDAPTTNAIHAAINKSKGDASLSSIQATVVAARDEILAADRNKDGFIDAAEAKKVKTVLGKALLGFTEAHAGDKVSDFKVPTPSSAGTYVPKTPFRMPSNPTGDRVVDALVKHFNAFANDNHAAGRVTTRFVIGAVETKGIAAEIAKMPKATRKAVLKALEARIQQDDKRDANWTPQRIWVTPDSVGALEKIAKDDGMKVNLRGNPTAPKYDYW